MFSVTNMLLAMSLSSPAARQPVAEPAMTVQEVEKRALEARRSIKNGHFRIECQYTETEAPNSATTNDVREAWFDGNRYRLDFSIPVTDQRGKVANKKLTHCQNYDGKGACLQFDKLQGVLEITRKPSRERCNYTAAFDPRAIGYIAKTINYVNGRDARIDEEVGYPNRNNISIVRVDYRGRSAWRITANHRADKTVAITYVPEWDFNVGSIKIR